MSAGDAAFARVDPPAPQASAIDPWQALTELRLHLAASGALVAKFRQTFVPAGFATGDEESGRVALALPDCLRWDYLSPYRKSFLLCGSRAWSWVEGEPQGQRMDVEAKDEAGLDLLLRPADELRSRYRAAFAPGEGGEVVVVLEPASAGGTLVRAELHMDAGQRELLALKTRDVEGNETRFWFSGYRPIADPDPFTPPRELEWKEP